MNPKNFLTPIRLAIIGARGRMGKMVIQVALQDPEITLRAVVARKKDPSAIQIHQMHSIIEDIDLLIDFSSPDAICNYIPIIQTHPIAVVIGTTDLQTKHYSLLKEAAYTSPIIYAVNFSFGIFLLKEVLQTITTYQPKCQIAITETHHKTKRDRPSGTAKDLSNELQSIQESIPIRSFRRASTIGTHKITIHLQDEDITIAHIANNRNIFAIGAIQTGKWLAKQPPGMYTIEDYFSCHKKPFISV